MQATIHMHNDSQRHICASMFMILKWSYFKQTPLIISSNKMSISTTKGKKVANYIAKLFHKDRSTTKQNNKESTKETTNEINTKKVRILKLLNFIFQCYSTTQFN